MRPLLTFVLILLLFSAGCVKTSESIEGKEDTQTTYDAGLGISDSDLSIDDPGLELTYTEEDISVQSP